MRLWGGRFGEENDARVADFTRSIDIDAALALDDLRGSIAHVRGLGRVGIGLRPTLPLRSLEQAVHASVRPNDERPERNTR